MGRDIRPAAAFGLLLLIVQQWAGPLSPVAWTVWAVWCLAGIASDWATQRWGNPRKKHNSTEEVDQV